MKNHVLYVRKSNLSNEKVTFCGKKIQIFDWYFLDAGHAIASIQDDSILPCEECKKAIISILIGKEKQ